MRPQPALVPAAGHGCRQLVRALVGEALHQHLTSRLVERVETLAGLLGAAGLPVVAQPAQLLLERDLLGDSDRLGR